MNVLPPESPVVVCLNGAPYDQDTAHQPGHASGQLSGTFVRDAKSSPSDRIQEQSCQNCGRRGRRSRYDPYEVHRNFPARWQAYIRANFRSIAHVTQVFEVSERTARKWWAGETGAVGGHVAIAVNEHPDTAPAMLFAAE